MIPAFVSFVVLGAASKLVRKPGCDRWENPRAKLHKDHPDVLREFEYVRCRVR